MKRLIIVILIITLMLTGCVSMKNSTNLNNDELKGIWISCYELDFEDKSEESFHNKINEMFDSISSIGFNAIFVHVRSHSDAYYKSEIFPFSSFISSAQGVDPGYDPLKIMIKAAKKRKLKFHAWINPFRVSTSTSLDELADSNPAKKYLTDDDSSNDNLVKIIENGIYYNPSSLEIHKLIISGIEELIENYDIDGIHFDDYFYPTTNTDFDKGDYEQYKRQTKNPVTQAEYRRINVNLLVSGVYRSVKKLSNNVIFGISPQANIDYNYNNLYADIEKWVNTKGYIDYIVPQIYFGFEYFNTTKEGQPLKFDECAKVWSDLVSSEVKLYFGLGIYRSGNEIKIGDKVSNEWIDNSDVIKRQVEFARQLKNYSGCILFSFSNLNSNENQKSESENLKALFIE